jgi:hypothetical protein
LRILGAIALFALTRCAGQDELIPELPGPCEAPSPVDLETGVDPFDEGADVVRWARSVALITGSQVISDDSACGAIRLACPTLEHRLEVEHETALCAGEPYGEQLACPLTGSGFLVAPRVVATAADIAQMLDCRDMYLVFGFATPAGRLPETDTYRGPEDRLTYEGDPFEERYDEMRAFDIRDPDKMVRRCQEVLVHPDWDREAEVGWAANDVALILLDRPVEDRRPLPLASEAPATGREMIMLGHPKGMPAQVETGEVVEVPLPVDFTLGRRVYDADEMGGAFFVDLMAYAGHGGAPLIDAEGEVAGLLIDGGHDWLIEQGDTARPGRVYEGREGCLRWNRCERLGEPGCPGSLAGGAAVVADLLERSGWASDVD